MFYCDTVNTVYALYVHCIQYTVYTIYILNKNNRHTLLLVFSPVKYEIFVFHRCCPRGYWCNVSIALPLFSGFANTIREGNEEDF